MLGPYLTKYLQLEPTQLHVTYFIFAYSERASLCTCKCMYVYARVYMYMCISGTARHANLLLCPPFPLQRFFGWPIAQLRGRFAAVAWLRFPPFLFISWPGRTVWHLYATCHPTWHAHTHHRPPQCSLQLAAHFD